MTIAITGATGQLGRLTIAKLLESTPADQIIALARSPEKAADLGVAVRQADYSQPDTLPAALQGVETLLLISGSEVGQRVPQHKAVIEAAKAAGVGRIVYTSLLKADTSPLGLAPEHVETEAMLNASGLRTTILRNGWYTENYASSVPAALQAGAFVGSAAEGRIASASRADYAAAAAAVLSSTGHDGKVYELAGDTAFTLSELAAEASKQTGKQLPYQNLPEAEFAAILVSAGLPEGFAGMLAAVDVEVAGGALEYSGKDLSTLIGRPTTPMAQTVAEILAA